MADPTLANYFGPSTVVSDSTSPPILTAGKFYLVVELDALGLAGEARFDPDKIASKLLITMATFTSEDTVNETGLELSAPAKQGFSTRKNLPVIAWGFSGTIYTSDESSDTIDVSKVI
jgi:hypothetical protein